MPTASPIIVITFVAYRLRSNARPMSSVEATAPRIASSDSTIGMPAAISAPNTTTSTTSAIGRPISSAFCRSFSETSMNVWFELPCPPVTTVNPATPSCSARTSMIACAFSSSWSFCAPVITGSSSVWRSCETSEGSPVS